jgi:antitoxin (DNA-binding transcriptional repressor) of toxin-antitoxin stability system
MKRVPFSEISQDFSRFLREAEGEEIVITRNGKTGRGADRLRVGG